MAKVKTTKTFNFLELINYIKKTNYQQNEYLSTNGLVTVSVKSLCRIRIDGGRTIWPGDMFEIEVEEEITEETVLPISVDITLSGESDEAYINYKRTIKDILDENTQLGMETKYIYLQNDDGTMTLVWKDGRLVD